MPGHPRLLTGSFKDVDARDKPGHDEERKLSSTRLFHRDLGIETGDVAVDRGHREHAPAVLVEDQAVLRADIAVNGDFIPLFGVTDIIDRHVVMLAPEERHRVEHLALPEHIARRGLALPLRDHPMFDANGLARMLVRPTGDVAGGIDAGNAGFQIRIDLDAAVDRKAALFGKCKTRLHADADDDEVGLDHGSTLQAGALALDRGDSVAEVKDDAVLFMQRADEVPHVRAQYALHRPLLEPDDMHLDIPRAQ